MAKLTDNGSGWRSYYETLSREDLIDLLVDIKDKEMAPVKCSDCDGTGTVMESEFEVECFMCDGTGWI